MKKTKCISLITLVFIFAFFDKLLYSQNINIFTADDNKNTTNIDIRPSQYKVKIEQPPSLLSNPQKNTSSSAFSDFMKERNALSLNLVPIAYANLIGPIFSLADLAFGLTTQLVASQVNTTIGGNQLAKYTVVNDAKKTFDFALSVGYDFKVLNNLTVSADVGFGFFDFSLSKYYVKFRTIYWSVGTKIFPSYKAPYGFFIFPKIGGTDVLFSGTIDHKPVLNSAKEISTQFHSHGVYISAEFGWRIQMFSKKSIRWPVKVSFDISILDIGYYINPWSRPIIANMGDLGKQIGRNLRFFSDLRFIPLPRIGFTISF